MKKLILAIAAVSSLSAGAAFAQASVVEAQAASRGGVVNPEYGPADVYGNSGWTPDRAFSSPGEPSHRGRVIALPDGRLVVPQAYANDYVYRPYASRGRQGDIDGDGVRDRRDTDRDGDGYRNNRDRYPDDYRRR